MRVYDSRKASDFQQYVRLQADIVKVIGEHVDLKKSGRHYIGRCPFHEQGVDKELAVYPDRQIFVCLSAGCSGGNVFDFIAKTKGVSRKEAVKIMAQKLAISADLFHDTPPPVAMTEPQISFSMLKLFEQCPFRYRYRYIDKKNDQKTTSYLAIGRILHKVLADFFKIDADERSLDMLLTTLDSDWKNEGFTDKQEAEESRIRVTEMLIAYFHSHDCFARTWRVEAPIKCSVGGLAITGVVDRIDEISDGNYELIDYKTEPQDSSGQNNMQLAFYYYGVSQSFKLPISKLTLEYLPSQQAISMLPSETELDKYIGMARDIARQIKETEHFEPKRNLYCADCVLAPSCPESRKGL